MGRRDAVAVGKKLGSSRGIDAVESNQPDAAAQYFYQALEYDEQNSMAWLWLASLSESSEGKLSYLEKVLEFDPENEAAGAAYKAARDSIRANLLAEARTAAVAGKSAEAHELLDAIIAEEPDAEDAWVLKSHLANGFDEKIDAFKRILQINPENLTAKADLESLMSIMEAVAPKAQEPAPEAPAEAVAVAEAEAAPVQIASEEEEEAPSPAEFADEIFAPVEIAEEVQPDVAEVEPAIEESETPAWMETKAEAETADEVYDGMIRINDVDETPEPEPENFDHVPAGFVDTDAENEYESADPRSSLTLVRARGSR